MHETGARSPSIPESTQDRIAKIYAAESRRVLATLIRLLGDIDQAEEALQESFRAVGHKAGGDRVG